MSKYTTELRYILETLTGEHDPIKVITKGSKLLFDFDYPFYTDDKTSFEEMFCKNFYTREIATETVGLWKIRLINWCNVNMPYYNELFIKTAKLQQLDIFTNVKITETEDRTEQGAVSGSNTSETSEQSQKESTDKGSVSETKTNTLTGNTNKRRKHSDTPQGALTDIDNGDYLSEYTVEQADATNTEETNVTEEHTNAGSVTGSVQASVQGTHTATNTGTTKVLHERIGKEGTETYTEMYGKYLELLRNVNKMILRHMDCDLFMQLW